MRRVPRSRSVPIALASVALLACGPPAPAPATARPHLGVQSNEVPFSPLLLRVRPPAGAAYLTTMELSAQAEVLGQPMTMEHVLVQERTVIEHRADGTSVLAHRTVSGHTRMAMGHGSPRDEPVEPEASPHTMVMDDRGRTIEDAMFAAEQPGRSRRDVLRRVIDPLLDALAYPVDPLDLGEAWGARDTLEVNDPEARGRVSHHVVQELVRVEGSGRDAVAVIAIRGELRGEGGIEGDGVSGAIQIEGAYTVALEDGLVRGMEVRVRGDVTMGAAGVSFPLEGTVHYRAEPAR